MTVHNPADVAHTTLKETLIRDPHTGNINARQKSGGNAINKDIQTYLRFQTASGRQDLVLQKGSQRWLTATGAGLGAGLPAA